MALPPKSIVVLWFLAACGPSARLNESGDGTDGSDASDDSGDVGASDSGAGPDTGTGDEGLVGTWVGYGDAFELRSGSDRIELRIAGVDEAGQITATLLLGEPGSPLPPPTDPDVGYPEGWAPIGSAGGELFERFEYTVTGTFDDSLSRLEASYGPYEVWSQWCALQTSVPWDEESYACLPNCGFSIGGGSCQLMGCSQDGPVDCVKLELCLGTSVCSCEADGCTVPSEGIPLDLHLDGDSLEGPIERLGTAFLTRQ